MTSNDWHGFRHAANAAEPFRAPFAFGYWYWYFSPSTRGFGGTVGR